MKIYCTVILNQLYLFVLALLRWVIISWQDKKETHRNRNCYFFFITLFQFIVCLCVLKFIKFLTILTYLLQFHPFLSERTLPSKNTKNLHKILFIFSLNVMNQEARFPSAERPKTCFCDHFSKEKAKYPRAESPFLATKQTSGRIITVRIFSL